jgi:hypothetical protein
MVVGSFDPLTAEYKITYCKPCHTGVDEFQGAQLSL